MGVTHTQTLLISYPRDNHVHLIVETVGSCMKITHLDQCIDTTPPPKPGPGPFWDGSTYTYARSSSTTLSSSSSSSKRSRTSFSSYVRFSSYHSGWPTFYQPFLHVSCPIPKSDSTLNLTHR